jgi:hypothetical protein
MVLGGSGAEKEEGYEARDLGAWRNRPGPGLPL